MSTRGYSPGTEAVVGWMARCPATGGRLFAYTELTARLEGQLIYKEHGFTVEPLVVLADSAQKPSIDPADLWERYLAETENPSPQGALAFAVEALSNQGASK